MRVSPSLKKSGYSLVETVVVLAILALLTASGYTYITNMNGRQDLTTAVTQIISSIKSARSMAISQQKPEGFSGSVTVVNVGFTGSGSGKTVDVYVNGDANNRYSSNLYDLSNAISVTVSGGTVQFGALEGKLAGDNNGTPTSNPITIVVKSQSVGESKAIVVSPNGSISQQ